MGMDPYIKKIADQTVDLNRSSVDPIVSPSDEAGLSDKRSEDGTASGTDSSEAQALAVSPVAYIAQVQQEAEKYKAWCSKGKVGDWGAGYLRGLQFAIEKMQRLMKEH